MPRWDLGRFGVERKCDCVIANRTAECAREGWHLVDTNDDSGAAGHEARTLAEGQWGAYRVIERSTGEVISPAMDFRRTAS